MSAAFEALRARVAKSAEGRVSARVAALADALRDALPPGVNVATGEAGVTISGVGLGRRYAIDPGLRWLIVESFE